MVQHRRFMELALGEEGLHTPDGTLALSRMTRADVVRHRSRDAAAGDTRSSTAGVVGGALIGGAVAGPPGALGGGLLGSTVRKERPAEPGIPRTTSASLIFESPELAYSTTVPRERVEEAEAFVAAVREAAGLR